ncbi:hypothetical protein LLH23_24050 [bacterium]|nr:hypothetical protein [bacterium]
MTRLFPAPVLLAMAVLPVCAAPLALAVEPGNLEGLWLFHTDPSDVGEQEGWQALAFADADWRTIRAPGGWEAQGITDPRPGEVPHPRNGMTYSDYDGVAWYRLHVLIPAAWAGQDLLLRLGSVDDEDRTFVNGQLVGATPDRRPGAPPLTVRSVQAMRRYVVPAALVRAGAENVIAVRVLDGGGPGGIPGPSLSLLPPKALSTMPKHPQPDRPLAERFADPPACARIIKIIHNWPDHLPAQDDLIETLLSQGFGGVVSNVSFTDYPSSEDKWTAFLRGVAQAKQAGMALWLYDERAYPSGAAGGITMEGKPVPQWRDRTALPPPPALHPDWEARGLFVAEVETGAGEVKLDLPPGRFVSAAAYPVREGQLDLAHAVDLGGSVAEGKLSWQAPAGDWHVLALTEGRLYEGTHAQMSLNEKIPYINLLMPEPTARFLQVTHDQYAARLGQDLGQTFISTFTDEPSLMSVFLRKMPYRPLPWSPNLPTEFAKRRGYELAPFLPGLVADCGSRGLKARYDYWQTVGELVSESFFGQIQEWCHRHGVLSGGHLLAEESVAAHPGLYGDFFRCIRRLDAPSLDCLTSVPEQVPWHVARLLASAGDLTGKTVVMCETSDHAQQYRPAGDTRPAVVVSEEQIRGTCNRLIYGGVNVITSYYRFVGLTSAQLRRLNEHIGRCCTMLTGGHQVTDVAVLYPSETLWRHTVPSHLWATDAGGARQVEQAYFAASRALYADGRDFTYVDSQALADAQVRDGVLTHGALQWRLVVLPRVDTLPMAAWENLARFWRQGGAVVALGALPTNSESEFPSAAVQALAREMFGQPTGPGVVTNAAGGAGVYLPPGSEALLSLALGGLLEPDVQTAPGSPIRATHRRLDGREVYFVINDSPASWTGEVSVCATGDGEQWDPVTGQMTPAAPKLSLSLQPYGATLLRFPQARLPRRNRPTGEALPGLNFTRLPAVVPVLAGNPKVQQQQTQDAAHSGPDSPAWEIAGTLAEGGVDTHLFACFQYPQAVDMSGAVCLALEAWAPAGQRTTAELLVILQDEDGGDYMANTGCFLGVAGRHEMFVPLSAFRAAGWSKDPDGKLDLGAIREVRVGWGGYFGRTGERLTFSLSLPQVGRVK